MAITILVTGLALPAAAQTAYTVKPGDSLYLIGRKYGITSGQLQKANNLPSTTIYSGQVLQIPSIYQVRSGDSWYLIGQRYGVTVNQLKTVNNLWSDQLYVGQKIVIPVRSNSSSSSSTPSRAFTGYSRDDIVLLARVINGEAGGEPYIGQVAVGAVILNRVKSADFPNTLSGVIYQRNAFEAVTRGLIWANPGTSCLNAAQDALKGWDPSEGALFFYNPAKPCASWIYSRPVIKRIGNHVFAR
ncbi:MAG: LysM peptidoglycan-binding domain-containing protein [Syntrophomonadaceae bacterium]|mgnify:CR=1 FL=1|nr:LysM peptidoglycan-binding domain-containing protein [Syntrophomonadaceae bacterium]